MKVTDEAIRVGFAAVRWPGRFEILRRQPAVVIDSAHNRESAACLRQALDDYFPGRPVTWIFAVLEDKDASGILAEMTPRLRRVIATRPDHPRALPTGQLVELVQRAGIPVETIEPAPAALERALELAGEQGLVLAAGSVAFAGEIRTAWENAVGKLTH